MLAPNMEGTSAAVASDDPIREEHRALLQENKEIQAQSDSADSLISGLSADALAGSLEGVMFQSLPRVMPLKAMWQVFVTCSIPLVRLIPALSP